MKKPYVRSDGNGGINISKSMMAFLGLLITLLIVVSSAVAYSVGVRTDVNNLQEDVMDIINDVDDLQDDSIDTKTALSTITTKLDYIIDTEFKEIKSRLDKIEKR